MMLAAPEPPGRYPLSLKVKVGEHELTSEGLVSIADERERGGSANIGCVIYKGILSNGALGSKKGLKTKTVKEH